MGLDNIASMTERDQCVLPEGEESVSYTHLRSSLRLRYNKSPFFQFILPISSTLILLNIDKGDSKHPE